MDPSFIDRVDWAPVQWGGETAGSEVDKMVSRLVAFGLAEYQIELILFKIIEKRPMRDVAAELGWRSVAAANYHLRIALRMLKERGFGGKRGN